MKLKPRMKFENEIDSEIIDHLAEHGKARDKELADLVGITVPSIRYHMFQLMARGIVAQLKYRNHQMWWFLRHEYSQKDSRVLGEGKVTLEDDFCPN